MTDGCTRTNVDLPDELWERLDSSNDSKKEQIVEALEIYFGEEQTGNRAAIERQIQRYQQQKARGQQMIQNGRDMVEEAEEGISRLNERLDQIEHEDETYEESLEELIEQLRENPSIHATEDYKSVKRIAKEHGKPASVVVDDLEARSDLDESRFQPKLHESDDDGLDLDDEVDLDYEWGESQ